MKEVNLATIGQTDRFPSEVIREVWEIACKTILDEDPNDSEVTVRDGDKLFSVSSSTVSDLENVYLFLSALPALARPMFLEKALHLLVDALLEDEIKESRAKMRKRLQRSGGDKVSDAFSAPANSP
jgi:hypothetical protein